MAHDPRACCTQHGRAARAGAAPPPPAPALPGMGPARPAPAGTGLSRRSLLLRSAGLALSVYGAGRLGRVAALEEGNAPAAAGPDGSVLLTVFLDGGADGLSVLAPVGDADYRKLRPNLALNAGAGP